MMLEEDVRRALADAAQEVRPRPEPYARLLRRRRSRRVRWGAAGAAAVAAALATPVALSGSVGSVVPFYTDDAEMAANREAWVQALVEAEPRGHLAADADFASQVTVGFPDGTRLLYADDVGDRRVAVIAQGKQLTYYVAARGATPAEVLRAPSTTGEAWAPFIGSYVEGMLVALAPPECVIETAALPKADDWRPVPTGSYLVRPGKLAGWWQVICGGDLRMRGPARGYEGSSFGIPVLDEGADVTGDLAAATAGARGSQTGDLAARGYEVFVNAFGDGATERPRLIWGGRLGDDARETVLYGAPAVGGGHWMGIYTDLGGGVIGGQGYHTFGDPLAGSPVSVGHDMDAKAVVVGPREAVSARVVLDGAVIGQGALDEGVGRLDAGIKHLDDGVESEARRAVVEALDASGAVVASGPLEDGDTARPFIDTWGE